jgi:hypothetical protein
MATAAPRRRRARATRPRRARRRASETRGVDTRRGQLDARALPCAPLAQGRARPGGAARGRRSQRGRRFRDRLRSAMAAAAPAPTTFTFASMESAPVQVRVRARRGAWRTRAATGNGVAAPLTAARRRWPAGLAGGARALARLVQDDGGDGGRADGGV